jgi:hypothetical protein
MMVLHQHLLYCTLSYSDAYYTSPRSYSTALYHTHDGATTIRTPLHSTMRITALQQQNSSLLDCTLPYSDAYDNSTLPYSTVLSTARMMALQQHVIYCTLPHSAWCYDNTFSTALYRTYHGTLQQQYSSVLWPWGTGFPQLPSAVTRTVDHPLGSLSLLRTLLHSSELVMAPHHHVLYCTLPYL